MAAPIEASEVSIPPLGLGATLQRPARPEGLVLFAHGSGSSRLSPRNNAVARGLNQAGFATLLLDLLTEAEADDRDKVFDIALLAGRLADAVAWINAQPALAALPLGLFGASTGAAAALQLAARLGPRVGAVVSRGGRPDLTGPTLSRVTAPTLLIVGGADDVVIGLNEQAYQELSCTRDLRLVPGATHLFSEPGAMEQVIAHASDWFGRHLARRGERPARRLG